MAKRQVSANSAPPLSQPAFFTLMPATLPPQHITGLILAGGRGSRMGGVDKGLQAFQGTPLALHALGRLSPQVGHLMLNVNRNLETYAALSPALSGRVWPDTAADAALAGEFEGPLMGFLLGLTHAQTPYVLVVPCDTPRLPLDLAARLGAALLREQADIAVAAAPETNAQGQSRIRAQPVCCLMKLELRQSLANFLQAGGRKIDAWTAQHRCTQVSFDQASDDPLAFANVNTLQELQALESAAPSLADIAASLQGYDPQALSVAQVNEFLAKLVQPLAQDQSEDLPLFDALGRVLAQDLISPINVPAHTNSAMDGFAFDGAQLQSPNHAPHSSDANVNANAEHLSLRVVGTALAGKAWQGQVRPGECLRIMTGAVMPEGLDTVVPQELTQAQTSPPHKALSTNNTSVSTPTHTNTPTISFPKALTKRGDNRRLAGEDLQQGQAALHAGQTLGPAALGLVASLGLPQVRVYRRLRVAYFSTGDEVLSVGQPPREGAVYDSNRYTVFGLLKRMGCEVIDLGVVRDDPALLKTAFSQAAQRADAVITSGGVSVGEADFTKTMMRELGDVAFWRIAMRPGRPMAVGRIGRSVLFGLPGNPVAVMVTFLALVRPALLRMMGSSAAAPLVQQARSEVPLRKKTGRTEYQRGWVSQAADGRLQVRPIGNQGSGVLSSMVQSNALIVLHHAQGQVTAGDAVDVWLYEGLI